MSGIIQDPMGEAAASLGDAKPKAVRKPRAKKVVAEGAADAKPKRASRAKKAVAETLPDGNVQMSELTREPSFANFVFPSNAAKQAEAEAETAKALKRGKKAVPPGPVDLALSPKWVKFRAEVAEGKYDDKKGDAFHPGKLSVQVSKLLVAHPELRTLVRDLLESRGRDDVKKIFGL